MAPSKPPVTAAVRVLRAHDVDFTVHLYKYVPHGGAPSSAAAIGADLHRVIKTMVMEDETGQPLLVLMHGDAEVSTKGLARHLGVKTVKPCEPAVAQRHSGYLVGGTSPFGTRRDMPVYMEASIAQLPRIVLNGGKRGFMVELSSADLQRVLSPELVEVATR